jgi:hypothetical protein
VESDALAKTYGIDTEVEYKDIHGNVRTSDVIKVSATVEETDDSMMLSVYLLAIIIVGAAGLNLHIKRRKQNIR